MNENIKYDPEKYSLSYKKELGLEKPRKPRKPIKNTK